MFSLLSRAGANRLGHVGTGASRVQVGVMEPHVLLGGRFPSIVPATGRLCCRGLEISTVRASCGCKQRDAPGGTRGVRSATSKADKGAITSTPVLSDPRRSTVGRDPLENWITTERPGRQKSRYLGTGAVRRNSKQMAATR